jgi:hypothetical protein
MRNLPALPPESDSADFEAASIPSGRKTTPSVQPVSQKLMKMVTAPPTAPQEL